MPRRIASKFTEFDHPYVKMVESYAEVIGAKLEFELRYNGIHCGIYFGDDGAPLTAVDSGTEVTIDEFLYAIFTEMNTIYISIIAKTGHERARRQHFTTALEKKQ